MCTFVFRTTMHGNHHRSKARIQTETDVVIQIPEQKMIILVELHRNNEVDRYDGSNQRDVFAFIRIRRLTHVQINLCSWLETHVQLGSRDRGGFGCDIYATSCLARQELTEKHHRSLCFIFLVHTLYYYLSACVYLYLSYGWILDKKVLQLTAQPPS